MSSRLPLRAAFVLAVVFVAQPAAAETPPIGRDHWARRALDDLARAGLLQGYAAGPLPAPDELTRYEAAAFVVRALRQVALGLQDEGAALQQAIAGQPSEPLVSGPRWEDLARLEKLIQEFRTELVTMGVEVDRLHETVAALAARLARVEEVQRRHTLNGYIQARFLSGRTSDPSTTFVIQRARLNFAGPVGARGAYVLEIAADGPQTLTNRQVRVLAAYARLALSDNTWVQVGQMKVPFGYEIPRSDAILEAPERLQVFRQAFFIYDTGLQVSHDLGRGWTLVLAALNGAGFGLDSGNTLDWLGTLSVARGDLIAGVSAYTGNVTLDGFEDLSRDFLGVFVQVAPGRWVFRGELVTGEGPVLSDPAAGANDLHGWGALTGYHLSGRSRIFAKFDRFDPNDALSGDRRDTWALIVMHDLEPNIRIRLAHEWLRGQASPRSNLLTAELQLRY